MGNFISKRRFVITITLFNVCVVALGILVHTAVLKAGDASIGKDAQKYPLLSKRLFVEEQNDIILDLDPLRSQIREYLQDTGLDHSFYMEYLPSGTSIRSGDARELVGASLMKLPVVMDIYKATERQKLSLDDSITITDEAVSKKFGLLWQAGVGAKITVREAVFLALTESDNTAARLLLMETDKVLDPRDRSLNFIDAEITEATEGEQPVIMISAGSYSSFLKCLYLSCYLSYDNSQEILELLTKTEFHTRIEAGISDKAINVAHKIGTFSQKSSSDCGIIYVPKRPYLFCLMINSTDTVVDKHIAEVSKMTYDYISQINKD